MPPVSLFTAQAQHVVTDVVPARPDVVRAFYVDLDNLILLHPLLVSVRTLSKHDTARGYRHTYRVRDNVAIGPLTMPISYSAQLDVPESGDVVSMARQFPRVRLRSIISFDPEGADTRITERIGFEAPRVLAGIVIRQAVDAHTQMLAAIRGQFQG